MEGTGGGGTDSPQTVVCVCVVQGYPGEQVSEETLTHSHP